MLVIMAAMVVFVVSSYQRVEQGQALLVNKLQNKTTITFGGGVALPFLHRAEVMDISDKTIDIELVGRQGVTCRDHVRVDVRASFLLRIPAATDNVRTVAQTLGCAQAGDVKALHARFAPQFIDALRTVAQQYAFEDLYKVRLAYKDDVVARIGQDLDGFLLCEASLRHLEPTPIEHLDPGSPLDASGIRTLESLGMAIPEAARA
jgi:uncharacterized membrane protein YqiK